VRLTEFTVQKFRNILDSTAVIVEDDVTCLVGKNESGKTATLQALYRFNPVHTDPFDINDDYPRWRLIPDRRANVIDTTAPITARFKLDPPDVQAVADVFGPDVLTSVEVTVQRQYGSATTTHWPVISVNERKAVENILDRLKVTDVVKEELANTVGLGSVQARVDAAKAKLVVPEGESRPELDQAVVKLDAIAAEATRVLDGKTSAKDRVVTILAQRLPQFFYFSNYHFLEGRIRLEDLAALVPGQPASSAQQTALALLKLAETTPQSLMGDDYEDRKAELEAVSNDLSSQVFEYWTQNPDLRVEFDMDRRIETRPDGRPAIVGHFLDIRVTDRRHDYSNNFSQRSSGFRWFFSFLAAFSEFERTKNVVVLLDEPGLTLHAKAQADFLRFINERLAPNAQVIYTTHSPFMIETDKIERVRIVEDKGPDVGAVVSDQVLTVEADSLFPLQAALGYDLAQHLFIGDANLVVEGPSDFVYLDVLSRHLKTVGRTGLEERWRILRAGGSSNVPAFVTLVGRNLQVTVLVDSGTEGTGRIQAAISAGRLASDHLVTIGEITGKRNGDVEDLFADDDYLTLYNAAFGRSVSSAHLPPGDRVVKRIETLEGAQFDHFQPAATLLRDQTTLLPGLSADTLDRFERLAARINSTLSQTPH
jgi:hypothetical protein